MANVELEFHRDVTVADRPKATGYRIHITRDDGEPISEDEVRAILTDVGADQPFSTRSPACAALHDYTFVGRDFAFEMIQWSDETLNIKTLGMGRAASGAWHQALLLMDPDQEEQVVQLQSKVGAARLVEAGYLKPHNLRGHFIVSPEYAGYKMGWRPTDSVMIFGLPFDLRLFNQTR